MSATPEPSSPNNLADEANGSRSASDDDERPDGQATDAGETATAGVLANGDWQAIYDPQSGNYYFRNVKTNETTWSNPFASTSSSAADDDEDQPRQSALRSAAMSKGIDPDLAHLDPSLSRAHDPAGGDYSFSARFDTRTGRFQGDPTFDPSRVSEFARGRKQAGAFFDVDGWEKSLEASGGRLAGTSRDIRAREIAEGKKLTKAEVAKFRQRAAEKKAKRQRAWLLD